ncbi:MAG: hypothetical protein K6C36_08835, partial [Clostridia bacterium]|nr:hypothetical protein [Clostridia bacterium]
MKKHLKKTFTFLLTLCLIASVVVIGTPSAYAASRTASAGTQPYWAEGVTVSTNCDETIIIDKATDARESISITASVSAEALVTTFQNVYPAYYFHCWLITPDGVQHNGSNNGVLYALNVTANGSASATYNAAIPAGVGQSATYTFVGHSDDNISNAEASLTITIRTECSHTDKWSRQYDGANHWDRCTVCGADKEDSLEPHSPVYANNNDGTHTVTCENCEYTDTVACSEFNETTHAATCAKGTYTSYECKQCGYTYDGAEADDKLSHELSYANNDNGTHTASCANCDYVKTDAHNNSFDSFVWGEGYATAQAKLICADCGAETLVAAAVASETTPATCEDDAFTTYTATYGDESEDKTVTDEGTKLAHPYEFDSFVWGEGFTTAQAKLVCPDCGAEKLVAAAVASETTPATCEDDAYTVYTATYDGHTEDKTVTDENTALNHDYRFDSFVWAADNTAQAKYVCDNNAEHVEYYDAEVTSAFIAAACGADAYTVYTATYGDETDSRTVTDTGTALTHNYLFDSFVWAADNTTAQVKLI